MAATNSYIKNQLYFKNMGSLGFIMHLHSGLK